MKSRQTTIPLKLRSELANLPEYKTCMLYGHQEHTCEGRITWEHAVIYAGKKIQEKWAIIALCAKGHAVDEFMDAGTLNKDVNIWIAFNRATDEELKKYSSASIQFTKLREKARLNSIYGVWEQKYPVIEPSIVSPVKTPQKAFWYPITDVEKIQIDKAITFHRNAFCDNKSPFEMIRHMIDSYAMICEEFPKIAEVYPEIYKKLNKHPQ